MRKSAGNVTFAEHVWDQQTGPLYTKIHAPFVPGPLSERDNVSSRLPVLTAALFIVVNKKSNEWRK